MGTATGDLWSLLVQASAFAATAGLMALLMCFGLGGLQMYGVTFAVIAGLSLPFGVLPYAIARSSGMLAWRHAAIAGTVAGTLFGVIIFLMQFGSDHSSSVGGVTIWRNGVPTLAGIAQGAAVAGVCAGIGALGGVLLRALVPHDILDASRDPLRPRWRDVLPLAIGVTAIAMVPITEQLTRDRSCFNPFRADDAPRSFSPRISLRLHVTREQWGDVAGSLRDFARINGWRYRGDTVTTAGYIAFQHGICREPGVQMMIIQHPFGDAGSLSISVTTERPEFAWQTDAGRLVHILSRHGRLTRDTDHVVAQPPAWLLALPKTNTKPVAANPEP